MKLKRYYDINFSDNERFCSFAYLVWRIFLKLRDNRQYEKMILSLPSKWGGWTELVGEDLHPLMFGKILYSFNGYAIGVGMLVKKHLPNSFVSDIGAKIGSQITHDLTPVCRFIISFQGKDVILTELKDMQLKEKLKPYVDEYSNIKLLIGLDSNEFTLIDNEEERSDFERIWHQTLEGHIIKESK
jgi:hypothetical protein